MLVTGSCDETVCSWEVKEDSEKDNIALKNVFGDHNMGAVSVVSHPTEPLAISCGMDFRIRVLDLVGGNVKSTIDAGPVECWTADCSPSGALVASGTHTGSVNIWNLETGRLDTTLDGNGGTFVMSVAFSPDGQRLAAGSKDGTVRVFDLKSHKVLSTLTNHTMPVRSLCFSPDNSLLFTASDDLTVSLYDAQKGTLSGMLRGHSSWVLSVAVSPDSSTLATGSSDNTVKLWNVVDRSCTRTFDKSHTDQVHGVSFNRDGTRLVSVGGEGNLQTYSVPLTAQA